ncbi:MAG TPA: RecX family transcriptional regulator [Rectinemataceae bacterium]|nr:RecX family transcriptional regulator [Rectinemataceae bacterium]
MKIESVQLGASGVATVATGGSRFYFRVEQLEALGGQAPAPGTEVDEEGESRLRLAAEAYEAERKGMSLAARAEHSEQLLHTKLQARGFSLPAIRLALARLVSEGFVDDRRFALAFAASRLARRSEGPRSLETALRAHGVDPELARAVATESFGPEQRGQSLMRAVERELRRAHGESRAVEARLRALGYRSEEIREALAARRGGTEPESAAE